MGVTVDLPPAMERKAGYTLTDALTGRHYPVSAGQSRLEFTIPADTALVLTPRPD